MKKIVIVIVALVALCGVAGVVALKVLPSIRRAHARHAALPASASIDQILGADARGELFAALSLEGKPTRALKAALDAHDNATFDKTLLELMRERKKRLWFDMTDVDRRLKYIDDKLGGADFVKQTENILNNLYKEQDNSTVYSVKIEDPIIWDKTDYTKNPETINALQRQRHWNQLATAYRLSGDKRFADKLILQIRQWAAQNPALDDWKRWRDAKPLWWKMDASVRCEQWAWVYTFMVNTEAWTPEINTLFLWKAMQHGQFLEAAKVEDVNNNHGLLHGQGLLYLADYFPEFKSSKKWAARGRDILFQAMDAQTYADGYNGEQSPNYAAVVVPRLLEMRYFDDQAGETWPAERTDLLKKAVEAYYQCMSPDGTTPALSDTYRSDMQVGVLFYANQIFHTDRYPVGRAGQREVWLFGTDFVDKTLNNPPKLYPTNRGHALALPISGNYIGRSGDGPDAVQFNFDAGPKGGLHGHLDLLNFELYGFGRVLISDPGVVRYDYSPERDWAQSTPSHNTISVDRVSHEPLDTPTTEKKANPDITIDGWEAADDHTLVSAHHSGYSKLEGSPVVGRTIWFDNKSTMVIVDRARAGAKHEFTISYTLPTTSATADISPGVSTASVWTKFPAETAKASGDVRIDVLPAAGQYFDFADAFVSNKPPPLELSPAKRFTASQFGTSAAFVTVVNTWGVGGKVIYKGEIVGPISANGTIKVRLSGGGMPTRELEFKPQF